MLVKRDAFARWELHRSTVKVWHGETCSWCGNARKSKTGGAYLYRYCTETDGGRKTEYPKLFCSAECFRSYV